ncbi:hypothetical protein PanWU01x14_037430, partial [Parasponia andersonii]
RVRIICDLFREGYMRPPPWRLYATISVMVICDLFHRFLCDLLHVVGLDKQETYEEKETRNCHKRNLQEERDK